MIITVKKIPKPFPGWVKAVTAWPFIVVEEDVADDPCVLVHELYHYNDQKKWFVVPWFVVYGVLAVFYGGGRRHPLEKPAYEIEDGCRP